MSTPPDDPDPQDEVLGRVDSLMARHRPPPLPVVRVPPPGADAGIPVLTDLVSLGHTPSAQPPAALAEDATPLPSLALAPVAAPATATDTSAADAPAATPEATRALEEALSRRLQERLDREIGELLDRRVLPEIAGALDFALGQVAGELKGTIRQLVREALEDTLASLLRDEPPAGPGRTDGR